MTLDFIGPKKYAVKVEGNEMHPASLGATDLFAHVLGALRRARIGVGIDENEDVRLVGIDRPGDPPEGLGVVVGEKDGKDARVGGEGGQCEKCGQHEHP